jgi:hypothetical protein
MTKFLPTYSAAENFQGVALATEYRLTDDGPHDMPKYVGDLICVRSGAGKVGFIN